MGYILDYSAKPSFQTLGESPFGIFFGIELEVEVKEIGREEAALDANGSTGKFAITKHDGSLNHGFEICSSPASLEYHYSAWNKFFDSENTQEYLRAFGTKTCGMHVHVSRAPLTSLQIGKMVVFIHNPANRKFIHRIAQRDSNKYNNYIDGRKLTDATPRNCVKFERHTAVNLLNPNTVEFRIFKSNLKRSAFLKNIEFCKALVDFTWPSVHSVGESQDWKTFCQFVKENRKFYPYLHAYLLQYKFIIPMRKPKIIEEIIEPPKEQPSRKEVESNAIKAYKKWANENGLRVSRTGYSAYKQTMNPINLTSISGASFKEAKAKVPMPSRSPRRGTLTKRNWSDAI